MTANRLTITLTPDQQKQIKSATGKRLTELNIDLASIDQLSEEDLDRVAGGNIKKVS